MGPHRASCEHWWVGLVFGPSHRELREDSAYTQQKHPRLILGREGRFLGISKPAEAFKLGFAPECLRHLECTCGSLEDGISWLAIIQFAVGFLASLFLIMRLAFNLDEDFSPLKDYICDMILSTIAVYIVRRPTQRSSPDSESIDIFSSAQFLFAFKDAILLPVAIFFYAFGGLKTRNKNYDENATFSILQAFYELFSASFKLFFSYISWSLAYSLQQHEQQCLRLTTSPNLQDYEYRENAAPTIGESPTELHDGEETQGNSYHDEYVDDEVFENDIEEVPLHDVL